MFMALALTLCTMVGTDSQECGVHYIDAFAGPEGKPARSLVDQVQDCQTSKHTEMNLASLAKKHGTLQQYLKRFNITQKVDTIDTLDFDCLPLEEGDVP